jgi:hypothetical protein
VLFADDTTVSRGMVKYACGIPKESIVDVEGVVALPQAPVESCSQKDVRGGERPFSTRPAPTLMTPRAPA